MDNHRCLYDVCIYMQREDIITNRNKRKQQLEKLLEEARDTMASHESGRKLLNDDEFTTLERKISAYQRKLDTMQGDMDDREVERVLQREKLRYERDAQRRAEIRQRASEL